MCSKSLWSLEWTTAELAQPRLGYIRRGLNGIKDSADVSQMKICPLGFCFVATLLLLLFYKWAAWIKGRRSNNHRINSDVCSASVPSACTCLKKLGLIWGVFCRPPRVLIMLREPFYEVTSALKRLCPCVSLPFLQCCISDCLPCRNGISVALVKRLVFLSFLHRGALIFICRPFQMRTN